MGVVANLIANAKTFHPTDPQGSDFHVVEDLLEFAAAGDPALPAAFTGTDEVQTLAASGASAGTFDITVGVRLPTGDIQVAVSAIAYNETPANIQTAVDSALSGAVTGYTNGDVAVSGAGTADLNDTVFTYSGASVTDTQHPLSTVDGTGLTGGGSEAFAETTAGQAARNVWALFEVSGIVDFGGTPPDQGGAIPSLTTTVPGPSDYPFKTLTLRKLAFEAEVQDEIVGLEAALLTAFGLV